ncbi:MAG: hypothetical protein L3V56_04755 [Candidatus Magnetoovum sp. WYHC-5]|nr:hypothetical protein [Candidatus Magnetoovum sp. WYHC-5]
MRKFLVLMLLIVCLGIGMVSVAFSEEAAQPSMQKQEGQPPQGQPATDQPIGKGWGLKSDYQRMYNTQTVVSIKGTVEAVEQITPMGGMSYGYHLKVKTDSETVSVHLGPAWFIERQEVKIKNGDTVDITGSKVTVNNAPAVIAAEVKKGDAVLKLRDSSGIPLWAGGPKNMMMKMKPK